MAVQSEAVRDKLVLEHFLPYRLNVLAALTSEGLARLYSARFDIGIPEWRLIATLGEFGRMTAKAIGQHSHMHKTKVSRAVADLIARGFVRRETNKADLREAFLSLTGEGQHVYATIAGIALTYQSQLVESLTPEQKAVIEQAMTILTERSSLMLARIREQHPGDADMGV